MDGVNYKHEGRGAWGWNNYIDPTTETTPFAGKLNPFIKSGVLNFNNYLSVNFPTETKIDIFFMLLGTNDVNQGASFMTDQQLNQIIANAKVFIDAYLAQFPNGIFVVGLPSSGGELQGGITQSSVKFRNCIQRLNLKYIEEFDNGNYDARVHCVHHGAYVDTVLSYNIGDQQQDDYITSPQLVGYDNIHPTTIAYKQFGRGLYCKARGILNNYFR
jgi:hypothetical protein